MNKDNYNNFPQQINETINLDCMTYEKCLELVKYSGLTLFRVPKKYRTYELCLEAVNQYGFSLNYVPDEIKDYNLCLTAVKNNAFSIDNVPDKFKTYELCLEAVKQNGRVLKYIPYKHRKYGICLEAIKQIGSNYYFKLFVPKDEDENNVCIETIIHNRWILNYIPDKYIDRLSKELQINELKYVA